ncbi:oxidoreductase [Kribbella sp. NBC_01245]|uniref:oxidoreductase n=1 Tax=Kribbella sp. NBC_01245 TaxID=2903578 RepID=UPI002E2B17DA|nr:oxidoreductase [Kribbella sp. NBC_01245]
MSEKVALVTGASSGIGEATALALRQAGFIVYGAARRIDRMAGLAEQGVRVLAMDVTDDASAQAGVARILAEAGRIDVLVNNAGYGSYGAVEDVPLDEARAQFEVNVFGAARLMQLVLPAMRAQRSGKIVNVSSMGGKIHTPLGGWYHSSKFALEGLSDCVRVEVAPFGIDVVVVEPGAIETEWGGIAAGQLTKASGDGAYAAQAEAMAAAMTVERTGLMRPSAPTVIGDTIRTAVSANRPRTRYASGAGAKPLLLMRRVLSDRLFDRLISRATGAPR